MSDLRTEIQHVLSRHSAERNSNTPDYVLADFLMGCLEAYDNAVRRRDNWQERGVLRKPLTYTPQWVEAPTAPVESIPQSTPIC